MIAEQLKKLYLNYTGEAATDIVELPSSGSNRRYFRLSGALSVIGVSGTSVEENRAFVYMSAHFLEKGLPVPKVYCTSEDLQFYLQEDLGDTLLFDAIEKGRRTCFFDDHERTLLHKTMQFLPAIQCKGAEGFDFSQCYPQPEFNLRSIQIGRAHV